eukprot:gene1413-1565_t
MSQNYSSLCRAQLTFEYLHTNSTTHEFLFGALAELVDNSRDAGATKMQIFTVPAEKYRGKFLLNFLDDGCGMDPVELSQVIQFGRSMKRNSGSNQIGQYGNGLKSRNTMSCLFLSRTFHEQEGITEVVVPMPSWTISSKQPIVDGPADKERYEIEMNIILKHSPYNTKEELFKKMNDIEGASGTLVVIYNLKTIDSGEAELDFNTSSEDILMKDPHAGEDYGFDELSYTYISKRFKTRSEKEVDKAEQEAKIAEEKAKELSLQAKEAMPRDNLSAKNSRVESQSRQMKAEQARINAEVKRRIADEKKKSLKDPKQLTFTFGFNTDQRKCDGMFIYNCNRLIRMCEKIGTQLEGGVKCAGIVGIVDVPYLVLEPTHNKQDFADAKEYKHLLKSMAEHMLQYWKDSKIEDYGVTSFWEEFGYTGRWKDDASNDQRFVLKRTMGVPLYVQCDTCLKWRQLQFSRQLTRDNIPDNWVCSQNTDNNFKTCSKPEQKLKTAVGTLQKEIKSVEQRAEQDIKKLKDKLEKAEKIANRSRQSRSRVTETAQEQAVVSKPSPVATRQPARISALNSPQVKPKMVQKAYENILPSAKRERRSETLQTSRKPELRKPAPVSSPRKADKASISSRSPRKAEQRPKQRNSLVRVKRPPTDSSEDEEDSKMLVVAKRKKDSRSEGHAIENGPAVPSSTADDQEMESIKNENRTETVYKIGTRVEAYITNNWYSGKIMKHQMVQGKRKVKVKFDIHNQDKFDKWYYETDDNLRLQEKEKSPAKQVEDQPRASSPSINEISSSIASPSAANTEQPTTELLDSVCKVFRKCLHYFRPPDFAIDKNDILNTLSATDLRDFPLSEFITDYERNITKLVGQQQIAESRIQNEIQQEVDKQLKPLKDENTQKDKTVTKLQQELASQQSQLVKLRLNVNVMLRKIVQEGNRIDPGDSSNHVDEYLEAIVNEIEEA